MSRWLCVNGLILLLMLFTRNVPAQSPPANLRHTPDPRITIDSAKTYSLPELVDMAGAHNPGTRDSWERARAQAAALGVARSELFPILAAVAVSETGRQEVLLGDHFVGQVIQTFEMELDRRSEPGIQFAPPGGPSHE